MDIRSILTNVVPILTIIGWALAAYIVLLWAASVLWTYRDIHARSDDVVVQVLAVALALLLPFAGILLHMILRPRQTLTERYERSLEEVPYRAAPPLRRLRSGGRPDVVDLPLLRRRRIERCGAPELPPAAEPGADRAV